MNKAFLSISFSHRPNFDLEIGAIKRVLTEHDMRVHVFVDEYSLELNQECKMMRHTFDLIQASDFLIAEVTHKAIGVGIEVGYAAALGKPIIYLRRSESEKSITINGVSTYSVVYSDIGELELSLSNTLSLLRNYHRP